MSLIGLFYNKSRVNDTSCRIVRRGGEMSMEMNYPDFKNHYHSIKVNNKSAYDMIEDLISFMENLEFTKKHEVFYPQGIFNDQELNLFFVTKSKITKVEVGHSPRITTWNTKDIVSAELIAKDRYYVQLTLKLRDDNDIVLDSSSDTNMTWSNKFKHKILETYNTINFFN